MLFCPCGVCVTWSHLQRLQPRLDSAAHSVGQMSDVACVFVVSHQRHVHFAGKSGCLATTLTVHWDERFPDCMQDVMDSVLARQSSKFGFDCCLCLGIARVKLSCSKVTSFASPLSTEEGRQLADRLCYPENMVFWDVLNACAFEQPVEAKCSLPTGPTLHWFKYFVPADLSSLLSCQVNRDGMASTVTEVLQMWGCKRTNVGAFTVLPFSLALRVASGAWKCLYWHPSWNAQRLETGIPPKRSQVRFLLDAHGQNVATAGILDGQRASALATHLTLWSNAICESDPAAEHTLDGAVQWLRASSHHLSSRTVMLCVVVIELIKDSRVHKCFSLFFGQFKTLMNAGFLSICVFCASEKEGFRANMSKNAENSSAVGF